MELPSMTKENSCELRKIADGASKHMHALQALKRPTSHWEVSDRDAEIRSSKLCVNCLRATDHVANKCTAGSCRICKANCKYNTLLHAITTSEPRDRGPTEREKSDSAAFPAAVVAHTSSSFGSQHVMLSTTVLHTGLETSEVEMGHFACHFLFL
ncbi:hypothetical protein X777_04752 [Ooceraea biroi]|uniref:Uncharacterized protein n=1 Tax=Ooceraea biroi TaxID=2015173 RepID=A0A026WHJ5_OOCBI|nr:hypothetical protein X777_04752 [Ooceraea biroi]